MPAGKPDAVLSDGREIFIDTSKVTHGEFVASTKLAQTLEDEAKTISKVTGLDLKELDALTQEDYQRIVSGYITKARGYVNPHSASGSINS